MILKKISSVDYVDQLPCPTHPNKKLVLFFAGWGMDERPFSGYARPNQDLIIAYDYTSLQIDESLLHGYQEIQVLAWSMGVWAASQLLPELRKRNYPISICTAINGTPFPIDDRKGIPIQLFTRTLNTLTDRTLDKFRLRMCGSRKILQHFLAKAPQRNIENVRKELSAIEEQVNNLPDTAYQWDQAYIGTEDRIFSIENQQRAWARIPYQLIDTGHYPEELFKQLLNKA